MKRPQNRPLLRVVDLKIVDFPDDKVWHPFFDNFRPYRDRINLENLKVLREKMVNIPFIMENDSELPKIISPIVDLGIAESEAGGLLNT